MSLLKTLILCLTLLLLGPSSHAQVLKHLDSSTGLSTEQVFDLTEDVHGRILLATNDGLLQYDGRHSEKLHVNDELVIEFLSQPGSSVVVKTSSGSVYKRIKNEWTVIPIDDSMGKLLGVIKPNEAEAFLYIYQHGLQKADGTKTAEKELTKRNIESFFVREEGLYLITQEEIVFCDLSAGTGVTREFPLPEFGMEVLAITGFRESPYIVTRGAGLYLLDHSTAELSPMELHDNQHIICASDDGIGGAWTVNNQGTLSLLDYNGHVISTEVYSELAGLSASIMIDTHMGIWIYSGSVGIYYGKVNALLNVFQSSSNHHRLLGTQAWNELRVVYHSQGIDILREDPKTKKQVPYNQVDIPELTDIAVSSDAIYIGTSSGNGLWKYTDSHGLKKLPRLDMIMHVHDLLESNGHLYIATASLGLITYDLNAQNIISIEDSQKSLSSNEVVTIFGASDGERWIATNPFGVYHSSGLSFTEIKVESTPIVTDVMRFTEDRFGNIYLNVLGLGLFRIQDDELNQILLEIPEDKTLEFIDAGHSSGLLMSTDNMIYDLSIPSLTLDSCSYKSIGINEPLEGQGISIERDGKIMMTTSKEISQLNLKRLGLSESAAAPFLTSLRFNGQNFPLNKSVNLHSGNHAMEIEYASVCLSDPYAINYRQEITQPDGGIMRTRTQGMSQLQQMGPGLYTLKVWSTDCAGNWSKNALVLTIDIDIPLYKKSWFISLMTILFTTILFGAWRLREIQNSRIKSYLQHMIDKKTDELNEKSEQLYLVNKEMMSSIEYAYNIQQAMFPSEQRLSEGVSDHYLFHLARNVVSGDFYWQAKVENQTIIVCADCTGHGVPGALVSMICMSELDSIVNHQGVTCPSTILAHVDKSLVNLLNANDEFTASDGMDAFIITIDHKQKTLRAAGAHQSCLIQKEGVLTELKGSRFHVGGQETRVKEFDLTTMSLAEVDRIFLFSDGIVDQFGSVTNRKFMKKSLLRSLNEESSSSLKIQCDNMTQTFKEWMGDNEQTDDILFIAIEF